MRALPLIFAVGSTAVAQTLSTPATGKFPALNVQVAVATKQRPVPGSSYRKTMTVQPKMTLEGTSRLLPIPASEATMLVITMDTRAKYAGNAEKFLVHGTETVSIAEAKTGARQEITFTEYATTFDSYRDSSNVGGEVYKYFVFGLRDPETKTLIDFKTNNPSLMAFVKTHPEKRDEILALEQGKNFPATFK